MFPKIALACESLLFNQKIIEWKEYLPKRTARSVVELTDSNNIRMTGIDRIACVEKIWVC